MKKIFLTLILFYLLLISGCAGYNRIMINHLSDLNNYYEYECIYFDINKVAFSDNVDQNILDTNIYDTNVNAHVTFVRVIDKNIKILENNKFFENITSGNTIKVKMAPFIYMDTNYFFIIEIVYNNQIYLDEIEGLQNLIEFMKENKSIF